MLKKKISSWEVTPKTFCIKNEKKKANERAIARREKAKDKVFLRILL